MVSLVDIVPQRRTVRINGGSEVELRGLGLRQIASLLLRFPELRKLFATNAPAIDFETVVIAAPDAISAIIATAAGQPQAAGNVDAMSIDDVLECLIAIRELTLPGGADPFAEKLGRLLGVGVLDGRAADMNMPLPLSN